MAQRRILNSIEFLAEFEHEWEEFNEFHEEGSEMIRFRMELFDTELIEALDENTGDVVALWNYECGTWEEVTS